jgi:hypothetical protein
MFLKGIFVILVFLKTLTALLAYTWQSVFTLQEVLLFPAMKPDITKKVGEDQDKATPSPTSWKQRPQKTCQILSLFICDIVLWQWMESLSVALNKTVMTLTTIICQTLFTM